MIVGHPPPEKNPLRARLAERLAYLDGLVRGGLDDLLPPTEDLEARQAYKERIQQYIREAERILNGPSNGAAKVDRVLMDVPVQVVDVETGDCERFTVVGPNEADPTDGRISFLSPLGSALLLKRAEETVVYEAPGGRFIYRVVVIGDTPS